MKHFHPGNDTQVFFLFFFSSSALKKQRKSPTESTFLTSDNLRLISEVNDHNTCRPRESKLLLPNLHSLTRQVLSGSHGSKGWRKHWLKFQMEKAWKDVVVENKHPHFTKWSGCAVAACSTFTGWGTMYKPEVHVRRHAEASHLQTHGLINSVSNWCEALLRGKWKVKG